MVIYWLNGYLSARGKILTDEFEEYLELINSLSYRELEYLLFLKSFRIDIQEN